jgi:arylsulfatase A-like enzyme
LGISAGVLGVFVRQVLADHGYVPEFTTGLLVAAGAACAYGAVQLGYVTVLNILWPPAKRKYLLSEVVSHLAVLVLVPFVLRVDVDWGDPTVEKLEPLIYLGAFLVLQAFFKLVTLYAILREEEGSRLEALIWMAATGLCVFGCSSSVAAWLGRLEQATPLVPDLTSAYGVDGEYATARAMPEGALLRCDIGSFPDRSLTLRWANPPDTPSRRRIRSIYVTVDLIGATTNRYSSYCQVDDKGWTALRLPASEIPPGSRRCSISWTRDKEPGWRAKTGLRPVTVSDKVMLLSGPFQHAARGSGKGSNVIVVMMEGLSADHVSSLGYRRDTTPFFDRLTFVSRTFTNAFTPAPDAEAASMTLLTGMNPLLHGYLGGRSGSLPESCRTLGEVLQEAGFATAAFTEASTAEDLAFGSGFERGFEVFDVNYPLTPPSTLLKPEESTGLEKSDEPEPSVASKATLDRAREWLQDHEDVKFFVFIRLHELRNAEPHDRYGNTFLSERQKPGAVDVYDTVLAYLDEAVGGFVQNIRESEAHSDTCLVVTSPYGYDFAKGLPTSGLTEPAIHVPLVLYLKGLQKGQHRDPVGLVDVAPTVVALAGLQPEPVFEGTNLRVGPFVRQVVSLQGDPLTFVMRDKKWRMVWQSDRRPFTDARASTKTAIALYDLSRASSKRNVAERFPGVVQEWIQTLNAYGTRDR